MLKLLEQFFDIGRVIVEVRQSKFTSLLGYCPKNIDDETNVPYFYFPYFMSGRILVTGLFDSMITSTIDSFNHMQTFKKLTSNSYFKKYSKKAIERKRIKMKKKLEIHSEEEGEEE